MGDIIKIYAVHQGDDDRSSGRPQWYFVSRLDAEIVADGRGWYGGDAPISTRSAITAKDGKLYLLADEKPINLNIGPDDLKERKERALKKLTPGERKMLGLEGP